VSGEAILSAENSGQLGLCPEFRWELTALPQTDKLVARRLNCCPFSLSPSVVGLRSRFLAHILQPPQQSSFPPMLMVWIKHCMWFHDLSLATLTEAGRGKAPLSAGWQNNCHNHS